MRGKLISLLLVVIVLFGMTFGTTAQDEEPIRVGLLQDLSGWLALYGVEAVNGFELGLLYAAGLDPLDYDNLEDALADVEVAGRPVELIIKDYGSETPASDADNAANAARELIESDFADIIFGTPNSGAAVQVQEQIKPEEYDILFFAGPSASPSITGSNFNVNTFRVCRNTDQDSLTFATVADQFGTKYIQLAIDTDFGRGTAAAFQASLEAKGIEFVGDVIYVPTDTTDFTPYLQQVLDSGADVLNPIGAGDFLILFSQQLEEMGIVDQMAVVGGTNSNDAIVAANILIPGQVAYIVYQYTLPDTEINDWLTERHIAVFQDVPDLFTECAFATAQAMMLALEETGGDPLPEAMIPALEGLSWEGPKGEYYIRPSDHQTLMPLYVIRFGTLEEVELAPGLTMTLPIYELVSEVSAEETEPPCRLEGDFADRCDME